MGIALKLILKKQDAIVTVGFIWLKMKVADSYKSSNENSGCIECRELLD
jgi:hypothetical protein